MTWCSFGGAIIATAVIALSLGNKKSAGLWPKEIHSVGPVQQLDWESVGAATASVWEKQKHRLLRVGVFLVVKHQVLSGVVKKKQAHTCESVTLRYFLKDFNGTYVVFVRCIHAAVIRSAAWGATATALTTLPPGALTAAGGRSAAIEMPCAAPATVAVTVSMMGSPSPAKSSARDSMLTFLNSVNLTNVFNPDWSSQSLHFSLEAKFSHQTQNDWHAVLIKATNFTARLSNVFWGQNSSNVAVVFLTFPFSSPVSCRHLHPYIRERALASHLTSRWAQQTPNQGAQLEEERQDAFQAPYKK